jgi:hypothetical protein
MDELTLERYPRLPSRRPKVKRIPLVPWTVILERRRVLDEGMKRHRPGRVVDGGTVAPATNAGSTDDNSRAASEKGRVWD